MSKEKNKGKGQKQPKDQIKSQASGKLFSRIIPWHIGLAILDPITRLSEHPQRLIGACVNKGQVVADLGCGLGNYTLALAQCIGPELHKG